ncbi:MAG: glycosyltransferase family 4 protein [Acidobacteriaceae bacterium]|nr:glycosyltransferase family 4 protein [Acidobacteriaceae bacterium]
MIDPSTWRMRIFHLVPNLNFGGLQEVVRGLALQQKQSGHSVTVGCWTNASDNADTQRYLEEAGVPVLYLLNADDAGITFERRAVFAKLKGYLGARNADVLHVHNPFDYFIYGAAAARAAGSTAIVNTVHATVMFDHPNFGRKGRAKFWTAAMLTDRLVSVCSEVETFIKSKFLLPGNKLCVVENGIDLGRFLSVPARDPTHEVVFGTVGRMSAEKNQRVLIDAFAAVRRRHSNTRLRLLGSGPLERKLKDNVRDLGLCDVVDFCGVSHDVPGFLQSIDVFVLPSNSEGLPLSLLEAVASGIPVIATEVGGVPRLVRNMDSGWLCAPRNENALADAMEAAVFCADRGERGERARRLVANQYSATRMAQDYDRVYRTVLQ